MGVLQRFLDDYRHVQVRVDGLRRQRDLLEGDLAAVQSEGVLLSTCMSKMGAAKDVLTKSSLAACESLATSAVRTIFDLDVSVTYDMEAGRFYLVYPGGRRSDLTASQSGGVVTVVSFVFAVYLILKLGCRRFMLWDEAWMAVSSDHYDKFINFVNRICADFGFDILLISHDVRLSDDLVSRSYMMRGGVTKREK